MIDGPTDSWAERLFRLSLIVLPRPFREEFGHELVEAFSAGRGQAESAGGTRAVCGFLVRAVADNLVTVWREGSLLRVPEGDRWRSYKGEGGSEMMSTLMRDLVVSARMLARRPVFTGVVVGTLALGIGANAAVFSVVDAVVLSALPFPDSEQLVRLHHSNSRTGSQRGAFSLLDREDLVPRATSMSDIAVYSTVPSGLLFTGGDEAVEVRTAYVSAGFFRVLGIDAQVGRVLLDSEERGDNRVVVLSHGFWMRRFGGDPSVIGRTIRLDDGPFLVTGVMPPAFVFPSEEVEAWVFLTTIPSQSIPLEYREVRFLDAVGRMAPGITVEQAASDLQAASYALTQVYPDENDGLDGKAIVPLRESMTSGVQSSLVILLGVVGLVLLIACANVANVLLSRGVERGHELATRQALGAGRGRLIRQLMTESVLLSVLGGGLGVGLAYWGTGALMAGGGGLLPRSGEVGIDGSVLLFSLGITVLTALTFGLLPAMTVTKHSRAGRLQSAARTGVRGREGAAVWSVLVAGQVSLAMLIVISSGLLLRSLWALQNVDAGFEPDQLIAVSLTINDARYPERSEYMSAYGQIMDRLEAVPGVASVASIRYLPLRRDGESTSFTIMDRPELDGGAPRASMLQVSPGFFSTVGTPMVAGRDFTDADHGEAAPVLIVNEALAERYWPSESPIGRFVEGPGGDPVQVVGVVADIRQRSLAEEAQPTLYVPQLQNPRRGMAFVLQTDSDPSEVVSSVRSAILEVDPDQPIESLAVMDEIRSASTAQARFFSWLLAGFATLAVVLASFGIYGVVSHGVSRRTSEIGIRVALGASRSGVLGMVVAGGMRPVIAGTVVGGAAAMVATRLLRSILFGVSTLDPVTFLAVPTLLLTIALAACWLPAARAVRIDPTEALRAE